MAETAVDIEPAFEVEVDLLAEQCAGCGLVLGLSTDWLGSLTDTDAELPVAELWHEGCAPADLRAAHAEATHG